ncbi:MAG TPA: sulfatase-like hydrolase/transferase [Vicinamibacteria bacterium]|nr:sulfatase-like hydrolase/transferase [Vicinamibacteria bacterium]
MGRSRGQRNPKPPKPDVSKRRLGAPFAIALASAAALAIAWLATRGPTDIAHGALRRNNLLFVTIDTLRADRLGSYGSHAGLTPHLDRLGEDGIVFEDVVSHVPLTLPAHTSIFTAKYPTRHGVHDNGTYRLGPGHNTLATLLSDHGYRTAAFVGAFVLDARFGLGRGFDHYDDYYGEKRTFESFTELERRAESVLAPAEAWLRERRNEPWLVWIHLFDPHAPYEAPEPFASRHSRDPYGAEIAYVDDRLGAFLARLDAAGLLENTLVTLVGDHGESLGEHGELTHGTFAYNATLSVPWILWSRAVPAGRFSPRVRHVDVLPTLLDLLGIESPPEIDGVSLRPFLQAPSRYEAPTSYFEALNPHLTRGWAPLRGVIGGRYKFIELPISEIYDLQEDPGETQNLAPRRARLASELRDTLGALVAGDTSEPASADVETIRRLASLGYLVAPVDVRRDTYSEEDDPKRLVDLANAHDQAGALFQSGHEEEALDLLEKIREQQPRSSFAHQKLAYALRQLGRADEAIDVLEGAVRSGLTDSSLLVLLGSYLVETGEVGKARSLLEPVAEAHPEFAEAHNTLGVAYARLGNPVAAELAFSKVLELDPSSATAHNNLGSVELGRGRNDEAVAHFERALAIDEGLASAHNGLGVAHARRGELERAVAAWKRAVELAPDAFDALYNLAMALLERSPAEAVPYLERFAAKAPPDRYREDIIKAGEILNELR